MGSKREEKDEDDDKVDRLSVEIDGCTCGLMLLSAAKFPLLCTAGWPSPEDVLLLKVTLTVRLHGMGRAED